MSAFDNASPAPRGLIYLATFNGAERAVIAASAELQHAIRSSAPPAWPAILDRHQTAQRAVVAERLPRLPVDTEGMRAQALHDLREAANAYAALTDGRRDRLFIATAKLAGYVAHRVLTEGELRSALRDAATANGAVGAHGIRWVDGCITRALRLGQNDSLPPLARRFCSSGRTTP